MRRGCMCLAEPGFGMGWLLCPPWSCWWRRVRCAGWWWWLHRGLPGSHGPVGGRILTVELFKAQGGGQGRGEENRGTVAWVGWATGAYCRSVFSRVCWVLGLWERGGSGVRDLLHRCSVCCVCSPCSRQSAVWRRGAGGQVEPGPPKGAGSWGISQKIRRSKRQLTV